jgi:predicted phage terminase large subunit-like protein
MTYVEKYFLPELEKMKFPKGSWEWRAGQRQLRIGKATVDFFSADLPENIEGSGYGWGGGIVLNEAGIILKNRNLWSVSILPMIMDGSAWVHLIGTPKGKLDPDGKKTLYYEQYLKGLDPVNHPNWKSFNYSTYDNSIDKGGFLRREDIEEVVNEQPIEFRPQEIYGEFIDVISKGIYKRDWFEIVDTPPDPKTVLYKVLSLDTAMKVSATNDDSAAVVILQTKDAYYIVHCIADKFEFPELRDECLALYRRWKTDAVLIEDCSSGIPLIQSLQSTTMPVLPIKASVAKEVRARAITPTCQARKVKLVKGPWNDMFLNQLLSFPSGHDDICDSFSQALNWFRDYSGGAIGVKEYSTQKLDFTPNYMQGF